MQWLAQGSMARCITWQAHGLKRARPAELVPGTVSVITARMDYLPARTYARGPPPGWQAMELAAAAPRRGIVSVYAGARLHKVACPPAKLRPHRRRWGRWGHRVFTDSPRCWRPSWPHAAARLARQAHAGAQPRGRLHVLLWARSTWTWPCLPPSPSPPTAAAASPAWMPAPRRPSWRPTAGCAALHLVPDH